MRTLDKIRFSFQLHCFRSVLLTSDDGVGGGDENTPLLASKIVATDRNLRA